MIILRITFLQIKFFQVLWCKTKMAAARQLIDFSSQENIKNYPWFIIEL